MGTGGALGAMSRYGVSQFPYHGNFPIQTLAVNLLGALLIGLLAGWEGSGGLSHAWSLFWKTGVCGGFTTFSTFSLETFRLLQGGQFWLGVGYALASLLLCLLGVFCGLLLSQRVFHS